MGVTAVSLDWTTLRALAEVSDDIGVLSLYLTADPHDESNPPAWRTRARTELKRLRDNAKHESKDVRRAIGARLDALDGDVETLLDGRTHGVGRAMFAPISNGRVELIRLQVPLDDQLVLAPTANLRPLVTAWSHAGPAGAVAVSVDEVRLVDLRFGHTTELAVIPHPEDVADRRPLTGRGHGTPPAYHSSASHHDLFEQREGDRLLRYLGTLGSTIADHAREQGWEFVALTGEMKYVNAVAGGLPPKLGAGVVKLSHTVTVPTPPKIAEAVKQGIGEARAERNRVLAERVCDAAMSGNSQSGACGLAPTLAALQEARVSHLVLAPDARWVGKRGPDGLLATETEPPPGIPADMLVTEPRLDEQMITLALREKAAITVLDPDAAELLAEHDGIGALLRW